jgi:hypothetical protein
MTTIITTFNSDLNINNIYLSEDNAIITGSKSLTIDCPIINIGQSDQQINIIGSLASMKVNNLEINDSSIVINKNGTSDTSKSAGILIANSTVDKAGYILTTDDGTGFLLKAPLNDKIATLKSINDNCDILTSLSTIERNKITADVNNKGKYLSNDDDGKITSSDVLTYNSGNLNFSPLNNIILNSTINYGYSGMNLFILNSNITDKLQVLKTDKLIANSVCVLEFKLVAIDTISSKSVYLTGIIKCNQGAETKKPTFSKLTNYIKIADDTLKLSDISISTTENNCEYSLNYIGENKCTLNCRGHLYSYSVSF